MENLDRAAGSSLAVGRRAVAGRGPLGRRGPVGLGAAEPLSRWAAGLFLAKPAVVVLLLKFSRPFTNGIGCFMAFSLESSISDIQAKSHCAIFQVLLLLRSSCCVQFLCSEYETV